MNWRFPVLSCLLPGMVGLSAAVSLPADTATNFAALRLTVVPGDYIIDARSPAGNAGVSDVFVRSVVVTNDGREALAIKSISFELQGGGQGIRSTSYEPAAVAERAANFRRTLGRLVGAAGRLVFGPDTAVVNGACAESTVLAPGEQLGILREQMRLRTRRLPDSLVVTVRYAVGGRDGSVAKSVPVRQYVSANSHAFPVKGVWVASGTQDDIYQHRLFAMEEFGFDLAALGENGRAYSGDGSKNEDFPMYGRDVMAVADGEVTSAVDGLPENAPGESPSPPELDTLAQRIGFTNAVAGNHVIIAHQGGEYSFYAHLMSGSVAVKPGQKVSRGDRIGRVGNSGNSTGPHLHFQLMDGPTLFARGLPCFFDNVVDPYPGGDSIALVVQNAALFLAR